jgi:hypothetical protein
MIFENILFFQLAAELAIKAVSEATQQETVGTPLSATPEGGTGTNLFSSFRSKEDFSFYSSHVYNTDPTGNFVFQRRVHFLSENRSEIVAYAANILIRCFHVRITFNSSRFIRKF